MLRLHCIGHACLLIEWGEFRIICDPHLTASYGGGLLSHFPVREVRVDSLPHVDVVLLSHSHIDHFDPYSLSLLNRDAVVIAPADYKIAKAVNSIGFEEYYGVEDWSKFRLRDDVEILWTPSKVRSPREFGIALMIGGHLIWNLVDSVVTRSWAKRVCAEFTTDTVDLLLAPCQPVLETRIAEGLSVFGGWWDVRREIRSIANACGATSIVPFADGHFCLGAAEWLNCQRMPYSSRQVKDFFQSMRHRYIPFSPGEQIVFDNQKVPEVHRSEYASRRRESERSRTFEPAREIGSLSSVDSVSGSGWGNLVSVLENGNTGFFDDLRGNDNLHFDFFFELIYKFSTIDENGEIDSSLFLAVNSMGDIDMLDSSMADIELVIPGSDLEALIEGRVPFMALVLGGRIREFRYERIEAGKLLSNPNSRRRSSRLAISATLLFNSIASKIPGLLEKSIDHEIEFGSQIERFSSEARIRDRKQTAGGSLAEAADLWTQLESAIRLGLDEASVSGVYEIHGGKRAFVGLMGHDQWHCSEEQFQQCSESYILPICLTRAQPVFGTGTVFPWRGYNSLLSNIAGSRCKRWRFCESIPQHIQVPNWRIHSIFPIDPERLIKDLRKLGWDGHIEVEKCRWSDFKKMWWLGMPRITKSSPLRQTSVSVRGITVDGLEGDENSESCFSHATPKFRLQIEEESVRTILSLLLSGSFRFSWCLPPPETNELFSSPVESYDEFVRDIGLRALSELVECAEFPGDD